MPTPAHLAARHLKLTFWGGVVLAAPLSLLAAIHMDSGRHWPGELPPLLRILGMAAGMTGILVLWGALPALAAGWLRLWPMRWLFERLQCPMRFTGLMGVGGTFLLFMSTVLLGTLLLYLVWGGQTPFTILLNICTGFSMPWLLASLWATWRVLRTRAAEPPYPLLH
jgi:hypothetical protein